MKKAAVLMVTLVATTATVLQGTPALADDLSDPIGTLACTTNTITTKYRAPGTVVYKFNGTCNDLNVINTNDNTADEYDTYAGMYRSGGTWITGTRGYIGLRDGAHDDVVLLSDVNSGTAMSVASGIDAGDTVKVKH